MKRVLYIHGYASSGNCDTVQALRELLGDRVVLVTPDFPTEPGPALAQANKVAADVDLVVASSYGAFIALNLSHRVRKLLINPCIYPSHELPLIDVEVGEDIVASLKSMESQLFHNAEAERDLTHAIFTNNDELFSYREVYLKHYTNAHSAEGGHRLDYAAIKNVLVPLIVSILSL